MPSNSVAQRGSFDFMSNYAIRGILSSDLFRFEFFDLVRGGEKAGRCL